ncbi:MULTISPECIES: signal peptidase II [Sphingomonadales]|uniref:Lipoprotein signal peptidase n=2 Tax=Edaphosphingomonas TaxID=3423724 RepID=A0A2T4HT75_9SPHN|nr:MULTISPECIES: signal peptidase II [Sphingomonas]AGH49686.1 lipoprotein signal peptidase [Sphingomonas sp. MM-1]MDX3884148.1 signal peptidase II [Sphingomonas sp.]OHT22261.1 Lipoprotein signal peptidase [Sphingomonas haloaromaticamans]PTD18996.1 signal peptidase II [Sphingomonas fennica]
MGDRRPRVALGLAAAAIVFILDQLLKWLVSGPLDLQVVREIEITSFFNLRWVENYGVSMGFLTAGSALERWLLVGMTATIALVVLIWMWREKNRADTIALGLVLGGAIGNIVDRVRLGYVVDFLGPHIGGWYPFLVFNVADAAITIGVLLLVLRAFLTRDRSDPAEKLNA